MKPLPGQDVYLRILKQGGDGSVVSMLLQQAPGQVHHQLPPHHLVTVDTSSVQALHMKVNIICCGIITNYTIYNSKTVKYVSM